MTPEDRELGKLVCGCSVLKWPNGAFCLLLK